jgi:acetate kinase
MNVLVFNCGSSSLKYRLMAMPQEEELAGGEAQRVGPPTAEPSRIVHERGGVRRTIQVSMPDHAAAFHQVMGLLDGEERLKPDVVAHRMVHGGDRFPDHVMVDDFVMQGLEAVKDMAPLHNPPILRLIRACRQYYPGLPQAVVFDTRFHETIPEHART